MISWYAYLANFHPVGNVIFIHLSLLGSASIIVNLQNHGGASCNFFMFWMHRRKPVKLSNSRHICHVQFHFPPGSLEMSWCFFPLCVREHQAQPVSRTGLRFENTTAILAPRDLQNRQFLSFGGDLCTRTCTSLCRPLQRRKDSKLLRALEVSVPMVLECRRNAQGSLWKDSRGWQKLTECSFEMWVLQDRYIHSMSSPWMCLCWMFVESGKLDWSQLTWNWTVRSCFALLHSLFFCNEFTKWPNLSFGCETVLLDFIGNCRWNQRATLRLRESQRLRAASFTDIRAQGSDCFQQVEP